MITTGTMPTVVFFFQSNETYTISYKRRLLLFYQSCYYSDYVSECECARRSVAPRGRQEAARGQSHRLRHTPGGSFPLTKRLRCSAVCFRQEEQLQLLLQHAERTIATRTERDLYTDKRAFVSLGLLPLLLFLYCDILMLIGHVIGE